MKTGYICIDDFNAAALADLSHEFDIDVRSKGDRPDEKELIALAARYDLIVIGAKEQMTREVFENSTRLRIIGTLSIGLDHICPEFIHDPRFTVLNTPNANVSSVAEHTLMLMLALSKQVLDANRVSFSHLGRAGLLARPHDIRGKTVGVVGAGKIGSTVSRLASAFGMRVLCNTANPDAHRDLQAAGVEFVSLDELLGRSDIISLHIPLNSDTRTLISSRTLSCVKPGSMIVNTSRAGIVDYLALKDALSSGQIGAIGLDDVEEVEVDLFAGMPNVIITPHTAGVTVEAIDRMDPELTTRIIAHVRNRRESATGC